MLCFSLELTVNPPCQGEIGETFYLLEDLLVGYSCEALFSWTAIHRFPGGYSSGIEGVCAWHTSKRGYEAVELQPVGCLVCHRVSQLWDQGGHLM